LGSLEEKFIDFYLKPSSWREIKKSQLQGRSPLFSKSRLSKG